VLPLQHFSDRGCQMICFQTKNPNFGSISEGLGTENVFKFYDHLEYLFYGHLLLFMAVWYSLWSFRIVCGKIGLVCGHLVYFLPNLVWLDQEKSGNPVSDKRDLLTEKNK
jgi:hypothetical protein